MTQCANALHLGLLIHYCLLDEGHVGECESIVPFSKMTAYNAFVVAQECERKEYAKKLRQPIQKRQKRP